MITRIDLRGQQLTRREINDVLPRPELDVDKAVELVRPLIDDVRTRGADALRDLATKFDGVTPDYLRVPAAAFVDALSTLTPEVRAGLEEAIARVRKVHTAQVPPEHVTELAPGATVRQRYVPVERVGLYAPGGLAVYPSSVIMNVVAAQAAGVKQVALASPPQAQHGGLPHPTILAACHLLGVDEVFAVGGAGAVAMFAYGVPDLCDPVDVITGPGNVYVAAAKRLVQGVTGIDAEAGPTEILVLADETAPAKAVALDLISQAEHDPLAASVLVTDSEALADAVEAELGPLVLQTKHTERVQTALSGPQSAIVIADNWRQAIELTDAYGAEHLELICRDAATLASKIRNAGAIFVGPWSPVSLGDYMAGSNHVLPTGGTAKFASALSVLSFLKSVQVIEYSEDALSDLKDRIVALSCDEDLPAHGEAVSGRFA